MFTTFNCVTTSPAGNHIKGGKGKEGSQDHSSTIGHICCLLAASQRDLCHGSFKTWIPEPLVNMLLLNVKNLNLKR